MRKRGDLRFPERLVFSAGLFLAFLLLPQIVFADGKHYPEKAYKVPPSIPSQRAILVYKDGIEKLIIESALEGKGKEFGWIIPLPSKPIEFEKASPGLIKTLSLAIQPKITHDLSEGRGFLYFISFLVTLWFLVVLQSKQKNPYILLFWILGFGLTFFVIFAPALRTVGLKDWGAVGFVDVKGVLVEDIQQVGSYELAVLEANRPDALDNWLQTNGFTGLNDEDGTIVSEYIKDGWCFVAAKLTRDADGYSQPHPLAMSFVADQPVYPLKLTSTVGSDVYLEIFVISYKQATCDRLTLEFSDEYFYKEEAKYVYNKEKEYLPGYVTKSFKRDDLIGHPKAGEIMWDGCNLSKLSGTLKPYQMKKDIYVTLKESWPYRKHYWSNQGARQAATNASLITWILAVFTLTIVFYSSIKTRRIKLAFTRVLMPSVMLTLLLYGMTYLILPKVETETGRYSYYHFDGRNIFYTALNEIEKERLNLRDLDKYSVEKFLSDFFKFRISINTITGNRLINEDSPGNFVIIEDERGLVLRSFNTQGFPFDNVIAHKLNKDEIFKEGIQWLYRTNSYRDELSYLKKSEYKKTVKAIIDKLNSKGERERAYIQNYVLYNFTGHTINDKYFQTKYFYGIPSSLNFYNEWLRWWEDNKLKTREEWLKDALDNNAIYNKLVSSEELAKLDDDSGIFVFMKLIDPSSKASSKLKIRAAVSLYSLGNKEVIGFLKSALNDPNNKKFTIRKLFEYDNEKINGLLLSELKSNPDMYNIIFKLKDRCPKEVIPIALKHIQILRKQRAYSNYEKHEIISNIEKDINLIALILKIVPPLNVNNEEQMNTFMQRVKIWLKENLKESKNGRLFIGSSLRDWVYASKGN